MARHSTHLSWFPNVVIAIPVHVVMDQLGEDGTNYVSNIRVFGFWDESDESVLHHDISGHKNEGQRYGRIIEDNILASSAIYSNHVRRGVDVSRPSSTALRQLGHHESKLVGEPTGIVPKTVISQPRYRGY